MSKEPCVEPTDHITKILKWKYELVDGQVIQDVELYGCTNCDATSTEVWEGFGVFKSKGKMHDAGAFDCDCFGCKAKTLEMNTGDARRDIPDKKWNQELQAYRTAREQGIQPAGTTRAHIEQAYTASEALGRAYDADSMPKAKDINTKTVEVMKEIGQI